MMSKNVFSLNILIFLFVLFLNLNFITSQSEECPIKHTPCTDITLCDRVKCGPPGNYSEETPYLILSECGCCEYWSKCQKVSSCGTCSGMCKHSYPHCGKYDIVSADSCGCCKVCFEALDEGKECKTEGYFFSLCKAGLQCLEGICSKL